LHDFIIRYWVEELFAVIIMILTWLVRQVKGKKNEYKVLMVERWKLPLTRKARPSAAFREIRLAGNF
jgi:hypothetical protein